MARITLGDDLDALITRFEDLVVRVLRRVAASAARLLGGTAASVPAGHVSVDDLGVIRGQWLQHLDAEVLPAVATAYRAAATHVADRLAYYGHDVAALTAPDAEAFLAAARNRLVGVGDDLWEAARDGLVAGMQAGEDMRQLAARVRDAAGVSEARARVIARTEVAGATNAAALAQVRVLGDPTAVKEWLATPGPDGVGCDERTRPTHCAADGQRVRIGERFVVGEALLDHPADPTGPPDEVIQCRCSVAVDLDDEAVIAAADVDGFHLPGRHDQKTVVDEPPDRRTADTPLAAADLDVPDPAATDLDDEPLTAGGFDETKHPRDNEGKFAEHPGGGGLADIVDDVSFEGLDGTEVYAGIRADGVMDLRVGADRDAPAAHFSRHDVSAVTAAAFALWRKRDGEPDEAGLIDDTVVDTAGQRIYLAISQKQTHTADPADPTDEDVVEPVLTLGVPTGQDTPDFHEVDLDNDGFDALVGNLETLAGNYTPDEVDSQGATGDYDAALMADHTIRLTTGDEQEDPPSVPAADAGWIAATIDRLLTVDLPAGTAGEPDVLDGDDLNATTGVSVLTDGSFVVTTPTEGGQAAVLEFSRDDARQVADALATLAAKDSETPGAAGIPLTAAGTDDLEGPRMAQPTAPVAETPDTAAQQPEHTGAMVALIPTEEDLARLAVDGGEPVDELHCTLMFLGEAVDVPDDVRTAVVNAVRAYVDGWPPVEADGFAVSLFNPGESNDRPPCVVLGLSGDEIDMMHEVVADAVADAIGGSGWVPPEQHMPWIPHVTLAYPDGMDMAAMGRMVVDLTDRVGPVTFDRVRVAFADQVVNIPLDGAPPVAEDGMAEPMAAAVAFQSHMPLMWPATEDGEDPDAVQMLFGEPEQIIFHAGRIAELSGVSIPAQQEATIEPTQALLDELADMGVLVASAVGSHSTGTADGTWDKGVNEKRLPSPIPVATARKMYAVIDTSRVEDGKVPKDACTFPHHNVSTDGTPGAANMTACSAIIASVHGSRGAKPNVSEEERHGAYNHARKHLIDGGREPDSIPDFDAGPTVVTAAGYTITIPDCPPAWWFNEPVDVTPHGALTITDEGRVYGYVAPAGVAHRSFPNRRVEVPMGRVDYSRWMGGEALVADGGRVLAGPITMECGHLPPSADSRADVRMQHYDNACAVVAKATVGESRHGVWIAGALEPGVSADQVSRMLACRLSGDWAPHPERSGWQEFVAALLVPVPGFPMARSAPSVRVTDGALVASAVPVRLVSATADAEPEPDGPDLRQALELIARGIGRDAASRMSALNDRVHAGRG